MRRTHFSCREALQTDAQAMVRVHHAAVGAIVPAHYSSAVLQAWSPRPDERRRDWLASLIGRESTLCLVAVSGDNTIMGFGIALPSQGELTALYIHPDVAGMGVGRNLLQQFESRCSSAGATTLALKASLNAEAFYRRAGYEAIGPTTQALTDTVSMAATQMIKRLSPGD